MSRWQRQLVQVPVRMGEGPVQCSAPAKRQRSDGEPPVEIRLPDRPSDTFVHVRLLRRGICRLHLRRGGGGRAVQCPSLRKGLAARGGTPSRRRSRTLRLISLCSCPAEPVREPTRRRRGAHTRALSVDAAVSALPQAPAAAKAVRATAQACPAVQASTGSTGSAARPAWAPFHSTLARRVGSRRQSPSTR